MRGLLAAKPLKLLTFFAALELWQQSSTQPFLEHMVLTGLDENCSYFQ
jgi:hypothetical protein